jgi:hypothetical protein
LLQDEEEYPYLLIWELTVEFIFNLYWP